MARFNTDHQSPSVADVASPRSQGSSGTMPPAGKPLHDAPASVEIGDHTQVAQEERLCRLESQCSKLLQMVGECKSPVPAVGHLSIPHEEFQKFNRHVLRECKE